ncbi:peptide-methionine (S)-S-oxide reductase MsrA [Thauera sp. WH-1]|uniref:peptide-methionine (S)-S-oxide reductase MsrA n=1 Tax=Thauera sp. WH-1 TaxID=3398230 RepID=UPI0039FDDCD3
MTEIKQEPGLETAIFGGGCFWCLEAVFDLVDGVDAVVPGYCGGHVADPEYRQVCSGGTGHAEVVKIDFDPVRVSYRELLEIFFLIHDPTTVDRQGNDIGPQYRSVIFVTSDEQLHEALAFIEELGEQRVYPKAIVTRVERAPTFWPAEIEHHDYYVNHSDQPYCQYVVAPKIAKYRGKLAERRGRHGG